MNDKAQYWVEVAEYDLETAKVMLDNRRFLYVGFMCHQVIEKMLKACYANLHSDLPPYTHNLTRIIHECRAFVNNTRPVRGYNAVDSLLSTGAYPF